MEGNGINCPNCGKEIGLWTIIRASLPDRIKCPNCKSRLGYKFNPFLHLIFIVLPIATIIFFISSWAAENIYGSASILEKILIFAFSFWLLWQLFELPNALYLRKNKILVLIKKEKSNPHIQTDKAEPRR